MDNIVLILDKKKLHEWISEELTLQKKYNDEFTMEWRNASRVYMVERVKIWLS